MKIKLDENLPARLVEVFGRHGHEADTVVAEGLIGRPDSEVWQRAKKQGRLFITQDLDLGLSTHCGERGKNLLTLEGAANYYWSLFIQRLQQR